MNRVAQYCAKIVLIGDAERCRLQTGDGGKGGLV